METYQAENLARQLMREHGLEGWGFQFTNAKKILGQCNYTHSVIKLSAPLARLNSDAVVLDTIKHEIAHAIAGKRAGHGPQWKTVCVRIGAQPTRCADSQDVVQPPAKYVGTCPACGNTFNRHRLSNGLKERGGWCPCTGKSFKPELSIVWREQGRIRAGGA